VCSLLVVDTTMAAQPYSQHSARHQLIASLELTGDVTVEAFDRIARLAANATKSPIALVTFVDDDRQWIPARVGWTESFTDLVDAFCFHAIAGTALMEVRQPHLDERFKSNRLVTGPSAIRFYAGQPIVFKGVPLGTVCILDQKQRALADPDRQVLADLAALTSELLLARQRAIDAGIRSP